MTFNFNSCFGEQKVCQILVGHREVKMEIIICYRWSEKLLQPATCALRISFDYFQA